MTLTKAISELLEELERPDLTEEEKKALNKYKRWLFSIKTTVTNNKEFLAEHKNVHPCFHDGWEYCDSACSICPKNNISSSTTTGDIK